MADAFSVNQRIYESDDLVRIYAQHDHLQNPEQTILGLLRSQLSRMKMLDIGVGGGRTTYHFAHLVKEYVGIDYSEKMIKVCRERFRTHLNKSIRIELCDVRSMTIFENAYFDFVLFSFNGIDHISYEDRLKAFHEIRRVCSKDGYFCFSTHNLLWLRGIRLSKNPMKMTLRRLRHLFLKRRMKNNLFALIPIREYNGLEMMNYFIKPSVQVRQLSDLGFKNIRVFSLDGREIMDRSELDALSDGWVYYLCNV